MKPTHQLRIAAVPVIWCAVLVGHALPAEAARARAGPEKRSAFETLGGMLQAAQRKLAHAERHHEKAVKQARQDAKALFLSEASTLGKAVGQYSEELKAAEDEFQRAVDSARAAANKSAAAESSNSWTSSAVEARARLAGRAEAAARSVRAGGRKRQRLVREAEVRVDRAIEDIGEHLSRRVGDLTPEVDEAKKSLEEEKTSAQTAAGAIRNATVPVKGTEEAVLQSAEARFRKAAQAAEQRAGKVLAEGEKALEAGSSRIEGSLEAAQREEIKGVRGASATIGTRPSAPPHGRRS